MILHSMQVLLKSLLLAVLLVFIVSLKADAQYPILDMAVQRVIDKYQNATCEQLWEMRGQQPSLEAQRAIDFLRNDPQMRQMFFNQVAGPVMNKMFECGMIP